MLDWALRESGSGLASLPEGSEAGLRRLVRGEVIAAAIHLHRLEGDDETANVEAVAQAPGLHDAVVIAFARREQGWSWLRAIPWASMICAEVAASRARMAQRPTGAGAQLLLVALMARAEISARCAGAGEAGLSRPDRIWRKRCARAVPIAGSPAARWRCAGLDFVPFTWERFDLVLRQRDYFLPGPQALFEFVRSAVFRGRAREFGGYDVSRAGAGAAGELVSIVCTAAAWPAASASNRLAPVANDPKSTSTAAGLVLLCRQPVISDAGTVQFSLKIHDDNQITRFFPGVSELDTKYYRCSP